MEQRLEHLVGKLVAGATALDQFFSYCSTMREGRRYLPYAKQLIQRYELTPNQAVYLRKTAERARRARTLVAYLEERFGTVGRVSNQRFRSPSALYRYMTGESAKGVTARPEVLFVEFNIPGWYESEHGVGKEGRRINGYAPSGIDSPVNDAPRTVMRVLRAGNPIIWQGLYYALHPREENPDSYAKSRKHEQRHLFDDILPAGRDVLAETTAYLFTGVSQGKRQDRERILAQRTERQERVTRLKELDGPKVIIESDQRLIAESDRELNLIEQVWGTISTMGVEGFGGRDLQMHTYVLSTTRPERVSRRLRQIEEWRALHPWKPRGIDRFFERIKALKGDPATSP